MMNGPTPALMNDSTPDAVSEGAIVHLRLMATTDLHMNLADATEPGSIGSLLNLSAEIEQLRATAKNSLLVDNGDFLNGSSMGEAIASAYAAGTWPHEHPMIEAMNALGYDAATLGNHEFSHGVAFLAKALSKANFPVVSANCRFSLERPPHLRRSILLENQLVDDQGALHRVKIGITGGLPPQTATWDQQAIAGQANFQNMAVELEKEARTLRDAGADLVIVLAHSGIGHPDGRDISENCALQLARSDFVDALVLGHIHLAFPGPDFLAVEGLIDPERGMLLGKPAVMAGANGSHVGVIDFALVKNCDGRWNVENASPRLFPSRPQAHVNAPKLTAELRQIAARAQDLTIGWANEVIGQTTQAIHSYFAMVQDCPSVELVNQAQAWYVSQKLVGTAYEHVPVLSATAPFRAGGRDGVQNFTYIPAGPIYRKNAADLYVHPNTVAALLITGAELRHWVETAAQVFQIQGQNAVGQPLRNPDFPSYHFDVVYGVEYQIDLRAAPGESRIKSLIHRGRPVTDDQYFILATNSYRISGSGDFLLSDPRLVFADHMTNRDVVIQYIGQNSPLKWPARKISWTFAPGAKTRVVFETSPLAKEYLWQINQFKPRILGYSTKGLLSVSIAV